MDGWGRGGGGGTRAPLGFQVGGGVFLEFGESDKTTQFLGLR